MDDLTRLRWIVGALLPCAFALAGTYRGRAARVGGGVSRRDEGLALMLALRLGGLAILAALVTWLAAPRSPALAGLPIPMAARFAGAGLAWLAMVLQGWVFHTLGLNITDTVVVRADATLITHGPYRWVRHPLYTVGSLFMLGIMLATASGLLLAAGIFLFALLATRTRIEESKLIERFGDAYLAYQRRTGRFLPRPGAGRLA